MSTTLDIKNAITPDLAALGLKLESAAVMRVIGRAASQLTKAHFNQLDNDRPNQLGGPRTHFWRDAAKSTSFEAKQGEAKLIVDHIGVAQRYHGGTILPVAGKYLTIPATPEAHGKRAGEFDDLDFTPLRGPKARGALTQGKKVFFWLVESIEQQPDPTVIPTDAEYGSTITSALLDLVAARRAQAGAA